MKGKLANRVGSQHSHATSEHSVSSITTADAHTSAASSRLNRRPRRFKWTRPFLRKTKFGFCACAITFKRSLRLYFVNVFASLMSPAVLQADSRSGTMRGMLTLSDQRVLVSGTLGQRIFPVVIQE